MSLRPDIETRLLAVTSSASKLLAQFGELKELREQLRMAQISARGEEPAPPPELPFSSAA